MKKKFLTNRSIVVDNKVYNASIYKNWQDEQVTFYGTIDNTLGDLVVFESNTLQGINKAFEEAVRDYLATRKIIDK